MMTRDERFGGKRTMKTIETQLEVGEDRMLHVQLPDDAPTSRVQVVIYDEEARPTPTPEERRAAARAGRGALRDVDISVEEFLRERREDDARRDKALGL
jgi:hypothetical protein